MITTIKYKDREEWLAIRRKYIGGSDAASVIGMNPFRSAYTLWAEKTGRVPEFEGNLTTEVGTYLEDFVAKKFEESTGKKVRRKNATFVNSLYPWACANVDREIVGGENALLEIKTMTSVPIMRQLRGEDFPEAYYCQCVHYLAVTGKARIYLAVLIRNRELKIYTLERDEAEIKALMNAEAEFWKYVEEDKEPPVDGTVSTEETLGELYPTSSDANVDLTSFDAEMDEYFNICDRIKELEDLKREKANKIKEYMGDAARGEGATFSVSYRATERETLDFKNARSYIPQAVLEKFLKKSTSRMFKITKKEA